ncbi:MAG: CYTH domain-containing protein [Deferribacterales bacterium]|jgi:CYTH domain-containing protein
MNEIERKFLADKTKMPMPTSSVEIRQGYIALDENGSEVRIREKGEMFYITVKSGGDIERMESEIQITEDEFEKFWPFTAGRRVEKVRYKIPLSGGLVCELDVFSGDLKGLVLAEVEFPSLSSADSFDVPAWFGTEVTKDSRYKNKNLAVKGL